MTEWIAIGGAVLVIAGVIVKKTKTKTDDKVYKVLFDLFNRIKK